MRSNSSTERTSNIKLRLPSATAHVKRLGRNWSAVQMPMMKLVPAENPDAYIASLLGWQQRYAQALRSTVVSTVLLRERHQVGPPGVLLEWAGPFSLAQKKSASSLGFGEASVCGTSNLA